VIFRIPKFEMLHLILVSSMHQRHLWAKALAEQITQLCHHTKVKLTRLRQWKSSPNHILLCKANIEVQGLIKQVTEWRYWRCHVLNTTVKTSSKGQNFEDCSLLIIKKL
jgi:hypothetical protein